MFSTVLNFLNVLNSFIFKTWYIFIIFKRLDTPSQTEQQDPGGGEAGLLQRILQCSLSHWTRPSYRERKRLYLKNKTLMVQKQLTNRWSPTVHVQVVQGSLRSFHWEPCWCRTLSWTQPSYHEKNSFDKYELLNTILT